MVLHKTLWVSIKFTIKLIAMIKQAETLNAYAVRKFMYYVWNFDSKHFIIDGQGEYLPSVFSVWEDKGAMMNHMVSKYLNILGRKDCSGSEAVMYFYFELDTDNQAMMADYIYKNYQGV